jgi:hypothetical protein
MSTGLLQNLIDPAILYSAACAWCTTPAGGSIERGGAPLIRPRLLPSLDQNYGKRDR